MKNICTNCSAENSNISKYCSVCGYKLENFIENTIPTEEKNITTKNNKQKSKKTIIGSTIGFIAGFIIMFSFFMLPKFLSNKSSDINIEKEIVKIVENINEKCPLRIDELTTLDSISILPNKIVQYNYTLDYTLSEVDTYELKNMIYPNTLNYVTNSPDMKIYRDNDVTFIYFYKDINGSFLTEWTITPELYK